MKTKKKAEKKTLSVNVYLLSTRFLEVAVLKTLMVIVMVLWILMAVVAVLKLLVVIRVFMVYVVVVVVMREMGRRDIDGGVNGTSCEEKAVMRYSI